MKPNKYEEKFQEIYRKYCDIKENKMEPEVMKGNFQNIIKNFSHQPWGIFGVRNKTGVLFEGIDKDCLVNFQGFFDNDPSLHGEIFYGYPVNSPAILKDSPIKTMFSMPINVGNFLHISNQLKKLSPNLVVKNFWYDEDPCDAYYFGHPFCRYTDIFIVSELYKNTREEPKKRDIWKI